MPLILREVDWRQFVSQLPKWTSLPVDLRSRLLEKMPLSGAGYSDHFGKNLERLLKSEWLVQPPGQPHRVDIPKGLRSAWELLRHLNNDPSSWSRSVGFRIYLNSLFGHGYEYGGNLGVVVLPQGPKGSYRSLGLRTVGSPEWLEEYLASRGHRKVVAASKSARGAPFADASLFTATQTLVGHLKQRPEPLLLSDLEREFPQLEPQLIYAAVAEATEQLLLFLWLRQNDFEPVLSILPSIFNRLRRPVAGPPSPVTPKVTHESAHVIDDIVVLLTACATSPLPLRQAGALYAKTGKELSRGLMVLPDWLSEEAGIDHDARLNEAGGYAQALEFLSLPALYCADPRLELSEKGQSWLAASGKERLKAVYDLMRKPLNNKKKRNGMDLFPTGLSKYGCYVYPPPMRFHGHRAEDLTGDILTAFTRMGETFARLEDFLRYESEQRNPLLTQEGHDGNFHDSMPQPDASIDELEESWRRVLASFVFERLTPLGAVRVGLDAERRLCFALTDPGRYLLQAANDFEYGSEADSKVEVIVQPNFDIVFLAPAPLVEAELARLAERREYRVGTLFNITKKSVLDAISAGFSAEDILATLQRHSSAPLPGNVAREIRGWAGQYRAVDIQPAVLIHCPDRETAAAVRTAGGRDVRVLADTVLELLVPKKQAALLRKLRNKGIFG